MKKLSIQYDNFSETFSQSNQDYNASSRALFYKHLDANLSDKTVLDLACGDGTDLLEYALRGADCSGIDASSELVTIAQKRCPGIPIVVGDMESLPYADASFDLVVTKYAIQTLRQLDRTFSEISRVLKPNGRVVLLTVHPYRQFIERKTAYRNYFTQTVIDSVLFDGKVTAHEPTHTMQEYLSPGFLSRFSLTGLQEASDFPASERIGDKNYPCLLIVSANKR